MNGARTCEPQLFLSQCFWRSRFWRIPRTFRHGGCFRIGRVRTPMMSRVAEVIAAAFSGGLSWRGSLAEKKIYCPPPSLKGHQIMISFEQFLNDNSDMADKPYGDAMASTLSRAFPCQA